MRLIWAVAGIAVALAGPAGAQESGPEPRPAEVSPDAAGAPEAGAPEAPGAVVTEETAATAEDDGLLGEEELDELVAPIALYPDSLLTQVLVAATYPLDLVKADRFIADNPDLSDKDRATRAEAESWDASVQVLAGGFPSVVQKMAADLDWTQGLGDAMLAQTDDVLDAVQRQRARAAAVGNLETNEAQTVEETDGEISIAPAQPDVVYVPQYDATTTYTTPYTQPAVIIQDDSWSNVVTTGAIAFGSALLIDEIFDDDDDWDNYWHDDDFDIDWDEGDLRPNRDIDINGDVNIDRDRIRNVDRDRVNNVDRDQVRARVGDRDVDALRSRAGERGGTWQPSAQRQADARARIAEREGRSGGAARERLEGGGGAAAAALAAGGGAAAASKIKARSGSGGLSAGDVGAKLEKRKGAPATKELPSLKPKDSAFKAKDIDARKAKAAANRGDVVKNKGKAKQAAKAHPKAVSKAKAAHKAPKRAAPKQSAMKKGNGHRASAAKARGGKSRGGGGRGGGGGRRR
ncbi:MAG TPA: DUF3300 domain-containing protein [Amaricoccus sp.]|nr:DUF3300 domain-containing protein [Amaricoccus sp.]